MKAKCCRDTPRCADCPVRVAAIARTQRQSSELGALINEVFAGRMTPAVPTCVAAALDELDAARFRRPELAESDALVR